MKKFLLSLLVACTALTGMAQTTYEENLIVTVNGESSDEIPASINVTHEADGTVNFTLRNFVLITTDQQIAVGNITLTGVAVEDKGGYEAISTSQTIRIEPGDMEGVPEEVWMGPSLGDVPIVLNGKLTDTKLYANIDIDMSSSINQIINVVAGKDEGFTTGISTISTDATTNATGVYTLNGVRVASKLDASLPKGVYVVNGHKIIK